MSKPSDLHPFARPDVLKRHLAILGKSGSGKTYAAKGAVEQLLGQGQQVVVLDPTSAWWGLRLARDGKTPMHPHLVIVGGRHADVSLAGTPQQGAAIAELVCREGLSCVLDTGDLTVGERTRWALKFAETLYRRVQRPVHLVIDEAHEFAPQGSNPSPEAAQMVHAFKQLASGGRSRGVRLMLITQRPAKLHKDVLTTAETLVAMRLIAPQDREAVEEWIKGCGDPQRAREVLNTLAVLKVGNGWYWCPELAIGPALHESLPITTYDSSATPEDGAPREVQLGQVDHARIGQMLAAVEQDAQEHDPKALLKRVHDLERQLAERPQSDADRKELERVVADCHALKIHLERMLLPVRDMVQRLCDQLRRALDAGQQDLCRELDLALAQLQSPQVRGVGGPRTTPTRPATPKVASATPRVAPSAGQALSKAQRAILTVLAQAGRSLPRATVAVRAGYSEQGGGFRNALSECRTSGWLEGTESIDLRPSGLKALGSYEPLPTGEQLRAWWIERGGLGKAEREILTVLGAKPELSVSDLAQRAGYGAAGGGFRNAISRLRVLQLISGKGKISLSQELRA